VSKKMHPIEFRTTRGNIRLMADAYGDPQWQPVLLAHGGGQTRHAWGKTAEQIADEGFYAVALDLRGHGESDWAHDKDYDFRTYAQDIIDVAGSFDRKPIAVGCIVGRDFFADGTRYGRPGFVACPGAGRYHAAHGGRWFVAYP
jgi:pimeloyl-ACP methyl ester carboxylesterase